MPRGARPGERRGGRAKGTPNKATAEAKAVALEILGSLEYTTSVRKRVKDGALPPAVECMLWHYAHGKPSETVRWEGELPPFRLIVETDDSDDPAGD